MRRLYELKQTVRNLLDERAEARRERRRRRRRREARRTRAEDRRARRSRVYTDGMRLLKEMIDLDTVAVVLTRQAEELGALLQDNLEKDRALLDTDLRDKIRLIVLALTFSFGAMGIDYYFLSSVTTFLMNLAGITFAGAVFIGKLAVACIVIAYELGGGVAEEQSRWRRFAYLLPGVVACLAAVTFMANTGITRPGDITLIQGIVIVLLLAFGVVLHYSVVRFAPRVFDGFAVAKDLFDQRRYERESEVVDKASMATYQKALAWIESYDRHARDYGEDVRPPFHLVPEATRNRINATAGHELIPSAGSFGGDGVSEPVVR